MGVSAVKWGSVILDALALPCVASTSNVRAGDTDLCDSLLDAFSMLLSKGVPAGGGEALRSPALAFPPLLY